MTEWNLRNIRDKENTDSRVGMPCLLGSILCHEITMEMEMEGNGRGQSLVACH